MHEDILEKTTSQTQEKTPLNIRELFARTGINPEEINEKIIRRLELLEELTPTIEDQRTAIQIAEFIFHYYDQEKQDNKFTETEKRTVTAGTLFSDIGKTGPPHASYEEQRIVAEIFGVEDVLDPQMPLKNFLHHYFPQDTERRLQKLVGLGVDPAISIRGFWNLHGAWTLQIIRGDGIPEEAVAAAATHHMLEGVNPEEIVGKDNRFTKYFGENVNFGRDEKLVIVLDKYVAKRRRGKKNHTESIQYLRDLIANHPRYPNDPEFMELIKDLDKVVPRGPN